jgi:hypothetical protein
VVPLLADWSHADDESYEVGTTLQDLKGNAIPLLAIFPANQPNKVFVLSAIISQGQLLDALAEAGPSRPAAAQASAADQPRLVEPLAPRR